MEEQTHYPAWLAQEAARRPGAKSDRPLDLLMLGGVVALGTLAGVLAIVYKTWYLNEIEENTAILVCGFLFFVYTGGVYIFCYAWERGDVGRAVRLTTIIVVLSAVAVLVAALVLTLLSKSKGSTGAGDSNGGEGKEINLGAPLRVLGSYVENGSIRFDQERLEPEKRDESDLFTVTCWQCGQPFIPVPPKAACPNCGRTAVTVA